MENIKLQSEIERLERKSKRLTAEGQGVMGYIFGLMALEASGREMLPAIAAPRFANEDDPTLICKHCHKHWLKHSFFGDSCMSAYGIPDTKFELEAGR